MNTSMKRMFAELLGLLLCFSNFSATVYAEGEEIVYSIEEFEVEGYETEIGELEGDAENGYTVTITNSHEPDVTEATVVKFWNDNDDAAGKRLIHHVQIAGHRRADIEDEKKGDQVHDRLLEPA